MHQILIFWLSLISTIHAHEFNILHHLGANSPWFAGPNINNIPSTIPDKCTVDQAIYIVRHGSRYPDPGAYEEWEDLHKLFQSTTYNASGSLSFLPSWKPVLRYPDEEIGQVSLTGYKELYNLGTDLRFRYPTFYRDNSPFLLWANDYPRTIDSARLFALGYTGPNTTLSTIHTINSTAPASKSNSLAPSDQCPNFSDSSGGDHASTWDDIYLPPITHRLNKLVSGGNLTLTDAQVALFPYLCGFETQITGRRSPWCEVFTEDEVRQYEYRQDLRYYYGTGPGAGKNMTTMFPILQGIVNLLQDGPTATATAKVENTTTQIQLPPLIVAFTHDNQINELASILGVFDGQEPLSANGIDEKRVYISSNITPMRGTITFERLNCEENTTNIRFLLNDAVYPHPTCHSGPGDSCPLEQYVEYVNGKKKEYGSFASVCGLAEDEITTAGRDGAVTFFQDLTLSFLRAVKP